MIVSTTPVILSHFEDLTDPRMMRTKRHLLIDMVAIALCAAICGAEGWADVERFGKKKREWFARFLELPNGIPSHDTSAVLCAAPLCIGATVRDPRPSRPHHPSPLRAPAAQGGQLGRPGARAQVHAAGR